MQERSLRRLGLACSATSETVAIGGLVLWRVDGHSAGQLLDDNVGNNLVLAISLGLLAAVLTSARPRNPLGWLLQGLAGANAVTVLAGSVAEHGPTASGGAAHLVAWVGWLASWVWALALVPMLGLLPEWYPDGRPGSRAGRMLSRVVVAATAVLAVGLALSDEMFRSNVGAGHDPLTGGALEPVSELLVAVGAVACATAVLVVLAHMLVRLRRSASPLREQLAWLVATVMPLAVLAITGPAWLTLAACAAAPVGIVVGVLRYGLFDIKLVLRSAVVYLVLTALVAALYAGVVGLTGVVADGALPAFVAAAVVAVAIRPAYSLLHRATTRLVYGDRGNPMAALTRLGRDLTAADASGNELATLAAGVAGALRTPYAAIRTPDGEVAVGASAGLPLQRVTLSYAGDDVGSLVVSGRTPKDPLTPEDVAVLAVLAGPIAVAVHASSLAAQLRESREQVVSATEDERTRLRQDLHDGIGPALSGVGLGLDAAAMQLRRTLPQAADLTGLVEHLRREVAIAVADVRRIIDDLRPAALDGSDLVTALRQHELLRDDGHEGAGLRVRLDAPDDLPPLAPDVEASAYRIALEAVTNARRHSGAGLCTVTIRCDEVLTLRVADDGRGTDAVENAGAGHPLGSGVGVASMRARAQAAGGDCIVRFGPSGTTVEAVLPLTASADRVSA